MVQVLARPAARQQAPPTLKEFEAYVAKMGWSHFYEHSKIEIAQSAQRLTRIEAPRTEKHVILAKAIDGLPVAYVGHHNIVYVIQGNSETDEVTTRPTIIPAQFATRLRYSNMFFSFGLQHVGKALYTCDIAINSLVLKAL